MFFLAKDDPRSQAVRRIVDCHPSKVCQNFTRYEIRLALLRIEQSFGRNYVIIAILRNFIPQTLRHRLIPGQTEFLMMNAKLNLKFLQALLFRREIVNISVGQVIRFAKETRMFVDDPIRQCINLFNRHSDHTGPKNVIIIFAVIEANQSILRQTFDFSRFRVDHAMNRVLLGKFPIHQQQVRKHLNIKENNRRVIPGRSRTFNLIFRFEVHLRHDFQAIVRLVTAAGGKAQDRIPHVVHVVNDIALVGFVHDMCNELDAWRGMRIDFFRKSFFDENAQMPLILNLLRIDHFCFPFQW